MAEWLVWALFFVIVVLAHILEGITGFGSTALSIVFLSLLFGIEVARPVLMLYTMLLCVYILARAWRYVDWRQFGIMIGLMSAGIPVGILVYNRLPKALLLGALAVFMVLISIRGLLVAFGVLRRREPKLWPLLAALFAGGVIQGAFSSGGPLIVLYSTEKIPEKSRFRATMCMIWLVVDIALMLQLALAKQLPPAVWTAALYGLPALAVGTVLGDLAHKKLRQDLFLKITYAVLLVSGIFMFFNL